MIMSVSLCNFTEIASNMGLQNIDRICKSCALSMSFEK